MSEETSDICDLSQVSYSVRVYDAGERDCVYPHLSPKTHPYAVLSYEDVVSCR